ncbi:MAG: ribonuclease E inhibitor RraB [Ilumatobacter sp.]|uniref:ribonuclease E inhibitor RraB n=1 Tax=Ilumatobacter sp. TaxID=1967498 RepID=UPI003C71369B
MAWEMFDRDGTGGFRICGVDGELLTDAPLADLPVACEITIEAESAAPVALSSSEYDLERVTTTLVGRIVATSRTRTSLVTLAYLPSDDDADRYSKVSLPKGASVSVAPAIDPEWTLFAAARPVGIEEQSMLDFRVRNQLFAAMDLGGERPIEHVVVGLTDETVDDFTMSVTSATSVVRQPVVEVDAASWRGLHVADPKDVTETSWIIRQIAERFGATYDGWGCPVETGAPAAPAKRKRRWFR